MKIKYILPFLLSPIALAQADNAASAPNTPADTQHCPRTVAFFVEGEALAQICSIYTHRIPENLQQTARHITDRLEQCSQNLNAEQKETMLQQLEQNSRLAAIKTVAEAKEERVRENWCQNAEQRLLQLLTDAQQSYGNAP